MGLRPPLLFFFNNFETKIMGHFDELLAKKVGAFEAGLEDVAFNVTTVAAAGSGLSDAGVIPASATLVNITGANGTKAVALPAFFSA